MLNNEVLTREVIGAAIEAHREPGPGLPESAYEQNRRSQGRGDLESDLMRRFCLLHALRVFMVSPCVSVVKS